jgi:branched-chain amino acid transport system substrate-binding protein
MLAILVAAVVAACGEDLQAAAPVEPTAANFDPFDCDGDVAVMAPYGGFGATDSVQMNWARVAMDTFNRDHGTSFTLDPANVDFDPEEGVRQAERIVANPNVIGVVGPKTSVVTKAAGPIFDRAGLVYVSPSATNATLTDGSLRHFYRVVASDALQAPTMANFIADELQPSTVLIVRDDEPYSQGLVDGITKQLDARGVRYEIVDVSVEQESYSKVVTRVNEAVNVVVTPLLVPTDAKRVASELAAAGKYPKLVGGDSLFVSAYDVPGAYVSTYAPDSSAMPQGREIIRLYESIFGDFEAHGGPAYVAMEVVLTAAFEACRVDGTVTRRGVVDVIPTVRLEETILGMPVAFEENHELQDATVQMYRVGPRGFDLIS